MVEYGGFGIKRFIPTVRLIAESDLMSRHLVENNFEEWKLHLNPHTSDLLFPTQTILGIKEERKKCLHSFVQTTVCKSFLNLKETGNHSF